MPKSRKFALLMLVTVVSLPGLVAATPVDVTISSVEVSPSGPVPGDEVEFVTTIDNLGSSDSGFFIDKVAVVEADDDDPEQYNKVLDIGTIPTGETKTVPLSVTFAEADTYELRVKVFGRPTGDGEQTTVQYPVSLTVEDRAPQIDLDANDTAVGVKNTGQITVANSLGSAIEDAELTVEGDGVSITNRREVLASLESGASETVEFGYRPTEPGSHTLDATLSYTTAGGTSDSVSTTVTVQAERVEPQLDLAVNDSVAGVESDGTVTVANGVGAAVRNVELTVAGDGVSVSDDREVFTKVGDGESVTTTFDYEADDAGTHALNATVTYSTGAGLARTVSETVTLESDPLKDRVSLDVSTVEGGNSQVVTVDVLNQGNAAISNVSVRGLSPNASVQRALVDGIEPGASRTVDLNATLGADRASVTVEAAYDVGNQRGSATATTGLTQTPGTIGLTGIEVVPDGGKLRISGSASNLGTTDAESVIVSVVGTDRVTPAAPNREFFVGTVPASDFVSFDVYAGVRGNVSTVPLEVSYLVDGDRRTRQVTVDAGGASRMLNAAPQGPTQTRSSGFPLPLAVGAIVALIVVALAVRRWRS